MAKQDSKPEVKAPEAKAQEAKVDSKAKYVAKRKFDDGSKSVDGKSSDYTIGEAYAGEAKNVKALVAQGLLCTPAELADSKQAMDAKDQDIQKLQEKVESLQAALDERDKKIAELEDKK